MRGSKGIKLPECAIEDVEDAYSMYVGILGISEDLFWHADMSFLQKTVKNISMYQKWIQEKKRKLIKDGKQ